MKNDADLRIIELGLILPPAPKPAGVYKPVLVVDKFLYVSGQGPIRSDGTLMTGRLG
ncbi:MAG: RidA family protein, partial [Bacteroidetes bacterium]